MSTASAYFTGSDTNPGAKTAMRTGAATTPRTVTAASAPMSAPGDMSGQIPNVLEPALRTILAQDGNECLGKGTLREQAAQEIRDAEGHEEGIGAGARAERLGDHHVAHEPEYPRCGRARADDPGRLEERAAHRTEDGRERIGTRREETSRMNGAGVSVSVLSGIRAVGIIARPLVPGWNQESRRSGELCPGQKARATGGAQAYP